jgi:RNA polymerase sigma-70 factor (ECF subfamily)
MTAFNRLMERHEDGVYRMALMYCKSRDNAYDITQNVFIKVYQNLNTFRGDSAFKTWLYKIVYYESLNWIRKNKRRENHADIADVEFSIQSGDTADDLVLRSERYRLLNKCMEQLNKKYKTVVYLKYFEGLSLKEIADIVNTTEGTIKNILFRSVRKLQTLLVPELDEAN